MNKRDVMQELEAMGTAQNREVYKRHGVAGHVYGVSYANQGKLKKAIRVDQALAEELWKTNNHDARVLATMIADPAKMTERKLASWIKGADNYVQTDAVAGVAARSPAAKKVMREWVRSREEWKGSAGWNVFSLLATNGAELSDAEARGALKTIETRIHSSPNRTRYEMNNALIAIGCRGGDLRKRAVSAAKRIGTVDVDHGETSCKTPDAASYIEKVLAHRKRAKKKKKKTGTRKKA